MKEGREGECEGRPTQQKGRKEKERKVRWLGGTENNSGPLMAGGAREVEEGREQGGEGKRFWGRLMTGSEEETR